MHPAQGERRGRVALLAGCAQQVLAPEINAATIRLLTRLGVEVVVAPGAGCCGALTHHMGQHDPAMASARANIAAWTREIEGDGLDAIVVNTSGCGTTVKDYGFMFRTEPEPWRGQGGSASRRWRCDISEFLTRIGYAPTRDGAGPDRGLSFRVQPAARPAGHRRTEGAAAARRLHRGRAGRRRIICCGSAGTYNMLQPEIAGAAARAQARQPARDRRRT